MKEKIETDDEQNLIELAKKLHFELFPEEYDYHYDSSSEAKERRRGINPMSQEYTESVNMRRSSYGVTPLGVSGLSIDNSSMQYCLAQTELKIINKLGNPPALPGDYLIYLS